MLEKRCVTLQKFELGIVSISNNKKHNLGGDRYLYDLWIIWFKRYLNIKFWTNRSWSNMRKSKIKIGDVDLMDIFLNNKEWFQEMLNFDFESKLLKIDLVKINKIYVKY